MKKFYYRFLLLLFEKPSFTFIFSILISICIRILSIKVILAEEYYHPLMGTEIVQQKLDKNKEIHLMGQFMKKYQIEQQHFYTECEKLFNIRMYSHVKLLMQYNIHDIDLDHLNPSLTQAYYEITRKFHHFYLENNSAEDLARQCIYFCKKYIPADMWQSEKSISQLTNMYLLLSSKIASDEQKAEALFLHAVITCYKANTQYLLHNDTILNVIFLQRLSEARFFDAT